MAQTRLNAESYGVFELNYVADKVRSCVVFGIDVVLLFVDGGRLRMGWETAARTEEDDSELDSRSSLVRRTQNQYNTNRRTRT